MLTRSVITLAFLALFNVAVQAQCDPKQTLQDLRNCPMQTQRADDGLLELYMQPMTYEGVDNLVMRTRAYAGHDRVSTLPGPVLRVRSGQQVKLRLYNDLGDNPASNLLNGYYEVNATNLHLHGMHVSGEGPGDDVTVKINPGEFYEYQYDIPSYHAGGMHYYHPHKHGAVTVQIGGGAGGMFIVDDDANNSPYEFLKDLPEVLLVLQGISPAFSEAIVEDELFKVLSGSKELFILTNGLSNPKVVLNSGQWYRFRYLHSSSEDAVDLNTDGCEMVLLAKDGIYLQTPRTVSFLRFLQPSRVDVAVRCTGQAGATFPITYDQLRDKVPVATIEIGSNNLVGPTQLDMSKWKWTPPKYIADMRGLSAAEIANTASFQMTVHGRDINGQTYSGHKRENALHIMHTNTVEEWLVDITEHPLHVHVNPFQLQVDVDEWNKAGDFLDTFVGPPTKVRTYIGEFTGKIFLHCHISSHADGGLAGILWVDGPEDVPKTAAASSTTALLSVIIACSAMLILIL